jgi:hypothetical protein
LTPHFPYWEIKELILISRDDVKAGIIKKIEYDLVKDHHCD